MYTVSDYGSMIADSVRTSAYVRALERAIKPNSVVVDLGTGAGIFALWACRLGAAKVYAIETNPVVSLARMAAKRNGFADRIEFIGKKSTEVELPERCDVLVSDLRGSLPIYGGHLHDIIDARRRFLKPEGVQIPEKDDIYLVPVSSPELYAKVFSAWDSADFDFAALRSSAESSVHPVGDQATTLLADPLVWTTLDYRTIVAEEVSGRVAWPSVAPGEMHGVMAFFRAHLLDDIGYENGPNGQTKVYTKYFFPLKRPVETRGLPVEVRLDATWSGRYALSWIIRIGTDEFRESTALAFPPPMPP